MFLQERIILAGETFSAKSQLQTQLGLTQPPAHIEYVPFACTRPQHGAPGAHFAHDCHTDQNLVSAGRVSACQRTPELARSAPQAAEEQIHPPAGVRLRQSQTQQEAAGSASHRCYITYGPGEALPSHGIRRMFFPKEVRPFEEPVASENCLVPGLWPEEGRIIADAQGDGLSGCPAP